MVPGGYHEAQGARRFCSAELLISVTSSFFSCMMILKPRNSPFSPLPGSPHWKTKSFTQWQEINCATAGTALRHQKFGSERTEALHSTLIKSQWKMYYNSLYSLLKQPCANSYTFQTVHFLQQYILHMRLVLLPIAKPAPCFSETSFSVALLSSFIIQDESFQSWALLYFSNAKLTEKIPSKISLPNWNSRLIKNTLYCPSSKILATCG